MGNVSKKRLGFPTKKVMKEVGISNSINLARVMHDEIAVRFSRSTAHERGGLGARFRVHFKREKTDPQAHWMDYGLKTFLLFGGESRESVAQEAMKWADEKYGQRVWIKDPWGSYQDAATIAKVWEMVDEKFPRPCRECNEALTPAEMAEGVRICNECFDARIEEKEDRRKARKETSWKT